MIQRKSLALFTAAILLAIAPLAIVGCDSDLKAKPATPAKAEAKAIQFHTGISALVDPAKAGTEAATKAKKGLGDAKPKLILIFAGRKHVTDAMVDAVAKVFGKDSKAKIFGCEGYSPLSNETNFHDQPHQANGVALLAVAGDVFVKTATADTKKAGNHEKAGAEIGAALKKASQCKCTGKLLLTFGDQHVGKPNAAVVKGLQSQLGELFPIVGAAAGGGNAKEIVAGKIVKGTNVGILLSGKFEVGLATKSDMKDMPKATKDALTTAVGDSKKKIALAFLFNCGGRRGGMVKGKTIKAEFDNMKAVLGDAPFFGFYGGGEIGPKNNTCPAKGVGYSVATAVILTK